MSFLTDAIATLAKTPTEVEDLARTFSEVQLSWKPAPNIFSVRENVWHLRDIDVEGYEKRVRLILDEQHPSLPDLQGGKLARDRNYNAQPIEPALADLRNSRAASMARLAACNESDLDRTAEMQGVGAIPLRRLLELWMEHDAGHVRDIKELRRSIDEGTGPTFIAHKAA